MSSFLGERNLGFGVRLSEIVTKGAQECVELTKSHDWEVILTGGKLSADYKESCEGSKPQVSAHGLKVSRVSRFLPGTIKRNVLRIPRLFKLLRRKCDKIDLLKVLRSQ